MRDTLTLPRAASAKKELLRTGLAGFEKRPLPPASATAVLIAKE
jgi:hypothetical protein